MCKWLTKNLAKTTRRLNLLEITAIKRSVVSQAVDVLSSLPNLQGVLKEINFLFYEFFWDGKGDKIKKYEIINLS